ncbi:MAG: hypothetical protein CME17_01060 [Gemmatimonadetes bacterium]|nr:hypothetical protein [Gemmatimonadota bacterium]
MGNLDVSVSRPEVGKKEMKKKPAKDKKMDDEQLMTEVATDDETKTEKSAVLSEDDLIKSLDKITELTKSETPDARKRALLEKALGSNGLEEGENAELQTLLSGKSTEPGLGDEIAKALNPQEDSALAKSIDVSDALGEIHGGIVTALQTLGETIEKGGTRQSEVNLVLAKGLLDIGKLAQQTNELMKSIDAKVEATSRQPIGGRRSIVRPGDVVAKSHAGQPPAEDAISKSEVMGLMSEMLQKSMESGNKEQASMLNKSITKIELMGDVDPQTMAQVADYRRQKLNGAAL